MGFIKYKTKGIRAAAASHVGKRRQNNEDNMCFDGYRMETDNTGTGTILSCETKPLDAIMGKDAFFAVFDGMGGGDYGEIASFTAADEARVFFKELHRLAHQVNLPYNKLVFGGSLGYCPYNIKAGFVAVPCCLVVEGAFFLNVPHVVGCVPVPAQRKYAAGGFRPVQGAVNLVIAAAETAYSHKVVAANGGDFTADPVINHVLLLVLVKVLLTGDVLLAPALF